MEEADEGADGMPSSFAEEAAAAEKRMSQMRLKKMSQMRLKKMSQMRLKKGGVEGNEVVEEMFEEPAKRLAQMRLKKDVLWDPRLVKGLNRNRGPDIVCSDLDSN